MYVYYIKKPLLWQAGKAVAQALKPFITIKLPVIIIKMDRKYIILQCVDTTVGKGLELGPLYSPIVSKEEARISYLDHMSAEDLKKKYEGHSIPLEEIVPVDYVLKNNSLKDTLKGKRFDYVIASHVMEHIPDLVSWFADVESILNDGGVLTLAIPDKRFTFDTLRDESRPADVIGAYLDGQTRASSVVMYDYMSKFRADIDVWQAWHNPYTDFSKNPKNSLKKTYDVCLENLKPGTYVDSHCFVFTPYSFFNSIRVLIKHDLFGYEVAYFKDTLENQIEFYVSLRKVEKSTRASKLRSLPRLPRPLERRELEGKIVKLEEDLGRSRSELEKEVAGLRDEIHNITASKSWKITKPIRKAVKITKTVRRK